MESGRFLGNNVYVDRGRISQEIPIEVTASHENELASVGSDQPVTDSAYGLALMDLNATVGQELSLNSHGGVVITSVGRLSVKHPAATLAQAASATAPATAVHLCDLCERAQCRIGSIAWLLRVKASTQRAERPS